MDIENLGLGRLQSADPRDRIFKAAPLIGAEAERAAYKYFTLGKKLDQGSTSSCVGHAWRQMLTTSPNRFKKTIPDEFAIYKGAQQLDEWPGDDYDGSSVRGGAKFLQQEKLILSYVWAWDADTVLDWILTGKGPVVFGTNWYRNMFNPDAKGFIKSIPAGTRLAGGHAYLAYGANNKLATVKFINSWGAGWGDKGAFTMPAELVERLIKEQGEACMALESTTR